ncbi:hypothetical protein Tco_0554366, partial [Tanacetum coccineum]
IAIGLAIINHQLPFEYTIASRSTDVMGPISPSPAADSTTQVLADWNAVYDAHNEMKGYVEQLECLGYLLPQDLSISLILNGLTSDFAGFVRNYNMRNIGKTIGELQALLIEYEKGLPKKAATQKVMAIQSGEIQKSNKKSRNAKGKGKGKGKGKDKSYIPKPKNPKLYAKAHLTKDDTCHHCKEVVLGFIDLMIQKQ